MSFGASFGEPPDGTSKHGTEDVNAANEKLGIEPSADSSTINSTSGTFVNNRESRSPSQGALSTDSSDGDIPEVVHSLARELTQRSSYRQDPPPNPFAPDAKYDSALNPKSPEFNARAWVKALLAVQSRDPERYPQRTAGIAYRDLNVHGFGSPTDFQKDVANVVWEGIQAFRGLFGLGKKRKLQILRDFEGVVEQGEMLIVLGRPGSGCTTLLKTIAGETYGLYLDANSHINYQGISEKEMHSHYRGEAIYTAETDIHFPNLSVGDTLSFAANARTPRNRIPGVTRSQYAEHMRDVVMAVYGLRHTIKTKVGNDVVRGISGGERKRVSIAEATLSGSPLQCWDNSTRGLDSANALEFCKTLRLASDMAGVVSCVAIYQASQAAYDTFDKVVLLYEGRQIYFGRTDQARDYFTSMGFYHPPRQTTADFLTSLTSPAERVAKPGYENQVPRTADEFAKVWKDSAARAQLLRDIQAFEERYPIGGESNQKFASSKKAQQSKNQRAESPYILSYRQQVQLCLKRGVQRLIGDPTLTLTMLFGNFIMSLIMGSIFYNLPDDTSSFFGRGTLVFIAILFNAFGSALEILTLYAQRPIVEKHFRYALYHPSAEAIASVVCDLPYKITNAICFNMVIYFMSNLRREPGAFFYFLLISFMCTLTMSMLFRTIAASSRTLAQAMAPAAILMISLVIYTGFVIPTRNMLGWARWINYIDPISYAFEALMVNEFHNRTFDCAAFVPSGPSYEAVSGLSKICSTTGATASSNVVDGDAYINASFQYFHSHRWRNFGILIGFMIAFSISYLTATEFISAQKSKGEVLLFPLGHKSVIGKRAPADDVEGDEDSGKREVVSKQQQTEKSSPTLHRQTAVFQWQDVCYDINIKGEERRILDHVDGWVKPGTLTALMGVSGAGKTTLLDVLASRVTMGVVTGEMLVDGRPRDASFQRKTGYIQQQDLHLPTTTVREALAFSALLRQPANVPRKEKLDYVDEVIKILEMEEYAEAVVGVPGEGLNTEQRKRLTIGVELVAKPDLLLFLDEPTSGLDSQTSWSICDLMDKLTKAGQAILCTIHQPSAMLFQRFNRLLFLAKGGKTVYFGDIGENSSILTRYFEKNGASPCPKDANPAEWMLEVIGAAPGSHSDIDWPQVWNSSPEKTTIRMELAEMRESLPQKKPVSTENTSYQEFAAPMTTQFWECSKRVFQQYWRTPSYIYSKTLLCTSTSLFIGFSFFNSANSLQGLQNQMFAVFMLLTIFVLLVEQMMPHFVIQRSLYEVRERPSKTFSWKAFIASNIIVELPWNSLMALLIFLCWYYPAGLYRNAEPTNAVHERGFLMLLLIWMFLLFTSTFSNLCVAGIDTAENAANVAILLFTLTLIFCGVLATPSSLPRFWIFLYRVSPFTYLISAMLSTAVANTNVVCENVELLHFNPANNQTCGAYMADYIAMAGGYLTNPESTTDCMFCTVSQTNAFLASLTSYYDQRWRNFGILWAYVVFNVCGAVFIYWLVRVPKDAGLKKTKFLNFMKSMVAKVVRKKEDLGQN